MNFPEQAATAADPIRSKRWGIAALVSLLLSVTLALQWGVGDLTLYSQAVEAKREALHFGILKNVPPEGKSWSDWGGFSVQRRIGVVYAAEAARQFTGQRIGKIYKVFDTVFLFLGLVALFAYLYCSVGVGWALLGVFYLIAVLPLTYHFALFHPWDRLQLLIWIGLLWLVQNRALVALSALLMLSVLVKPDAIFVPFLFLAMHWSESGRRKVLGEFLVLLILTWGLYFFLGAWLSDPHGASKTSGGMLVQIQHNLTTFRDMSFRFPPLLVHALPFALALAGWKTSSHNQRISLVFALTMAVVFFAFSNFVEVRAHMMLLVLVLPGALQITQRLLKDWPIDARANQV
jgi:hypothetical protein